MTIIQLILSIKKLERFRKLDLGRFDVAYEGAIFHVLITPDKKLLDEWQEIVLARRKIAKAKRVAVERRYQKNISVIKGNEDLLKLEEQIYNEARESIKRGSAKLSRPEMVWFSKIWLNVTLQEIEQIQAHLLKYNPLAWAFLQRETHAIMKRFAG